MLVQRNIDAKLKLLSDGKQQLESAPSESGAPPAEYSERQAESKRKRAEIELLEEKVLLSTSLS